VYINELSATIAIYPAGQHARLVEPVGWCVTCGHVAPHSVLGDNTRGTCGHVAPHSVLCDNTRGTCGHVAPHSVLGDNTGGTCGHVAHHPFSFRQVVTPRVRNPENARHNEPRRCSLSRQPICTAVNILIGALSTCAGHGAKYHARGQLYCSCAVCTGRGGSETRRPQPWRCHPLQHRLSRSGVQSECWVPLLWPPLSCNDLAVHGTFAHCTVRNIFKHSVTHSYSNGTSSSLFCPLHAWGRLQYLGRPCRQSLVLGRDGWDL
jgi:hypothetical protein